MRALHTHTPSIERPHARTHNIHARIHTIHPPSTPFTHHPHSRVHPHAVQRRPPRTALPPATGGDTTMAPWSTAFYDRVVSVTRIRRRKEHRFGCRHRTAVCSGIAFGSLCSPGDCGILPELDIIKEQWMNESVLLNSRSRVTVMFTVWMCCDVLCYCTVLEKP